MWVERKLPVTVYSTGIEFNRIQHLRVLSNTQIVLGGSLGEASILHT